MSFHRMDLKFRRQALVLPLGAEMASAPRAQRRPIARFDHLFMKSLHVDPSTACLAQIPTPFGMTEDGFAIHPAIPSGAREQRNGLLAWRQGSADSAIFLSLRSHG